MKKEEKTKITIVIPSWIDQEVEDLAADNGMSKSGLIVYALKMLISSLSDDIEGE